MRALRWGRPLAVLALLSPLALAAAAPAGTVIGNSASLTYGDNGTPRSAASGAANIVVAELLDVAAVANDPGDVVVSTPQANAVLSFTLTNTGNGSETWNLAANVALAGDQFDPANPRTFIDDGSGVFDAADVQAASVTLNAGESKTVFVVSDVPAALINNNRGLVTLTATAATGSGAPGTVFAGQGTGGTDAVVGASGATVTVGGALKVSALPPPSPSSIAFYEYAPGNSGTTSLLADGGAYDDGTGNFTALPAPTTATGSPIATASPVSVRVAGVYHAREPIFVALADANRNIDPTVRETVDLTLTTSSGDREVLRLLETGPNTGVFVAAIQTGSLPTGVLCAVTHPQCSQNDGRLSVGPGGQIGASYQDTIYPSDSSQGSVLVDPFGVLFNSASGAPMSGATVTLVNSDTGAPAQVYGDDGSSLYPPSVVTGATVTDSSGSVYAYGTGQFRFPFVAPGNYRLVVTPPAGFLAPSIVPAGSLPGAPGGGSYAVGTGSYADIFTVTAGPALNIDIPVDPVVTLLALDKSTSLPEASAGDFIQYRLRLQNTSPSVTASAITLTDVLPAGLRYRSGSLRLDGVAAPDPTIASDGRTLAIVAGTLAPNATRQVSYVAQVVAGLSPGDAVNTARASANGGTDISNVAQAKVKIRRPLFTDGFTVIGRVGEGACNEAWEKMKGLPNARLLLDDGTYVVTDADGQYHFEGVRPGTHVVQLDLDSLPPDYEVQPCIRNTRTAGRSYSQFLDVRGGGLWRADFFVAHRTPPPPVVAAPEAPAAPATHDYTLRAQFDSGRASLRPEGQAAVGKLAEQLRGQDIGRIEVVGHTDNQKLAGATRRRFHDNAGLSLARAQSVAQALAAALNLPAERIVATGRGADEPLESNGTEAGRARNRRTEVKVTGSEAVQPAPAPAAAVTQAPAAIVAPAEGAVAVAPTSPPAPTPAAVAPKDWLAGQAPGIEWLYPAADAPLHGLTEIVIKHAPDQRVFLKYRPGEESHPIQFEGTQLSADGNVAVSRWTGVPLDAGRTTLEALVADAHGAPVVVLSRSVGGVSVAARAELVADKSTLVADGVHAPVLAVRVVDEGGHPVAAGTHGAFTVQPPHRASGQQQAEQQRALAGLDRFHPVWEVKGEDGLAYLELVPTTQTGSVAIQVEMPDGAKARRQALSAWLEPQLRDWVVVGFAEGTVGYSTLHGNVQPLAGTEDKTYTDGQVSLYAKGRVLGQWLLTLAYDSGKPDEAERRKSLLSTIDPNQYYTLYGDGTAQRHDAASQDKLYLKLERGQFYALFGDYDTALNQTQLMRYNRTLSGFKSEYGQGPVVFTAYAAQTPLDYARDEIQGNGTSGLYRLSRGNLVLNSEKVTLETRDRLHSERIVQARSLARHLDYDVDYAAGTLYFREPVMSRDTDFNPQFIVVEYETDATTDEALNAGGRVAYRILDHVELGVSGIRDESSLGATKLEGADLKFKLDDSSSLRLEGARSDGHQGLLAPSGGAWLAEYELHDAKVDALLYSRSQDAGFGVGQQNGAERGQQKTGASSRLKLSEQWALQAEAWRQEDMNSDAHRNAVQGKLQYSTPRGGASLGLQMVRDSAVTGEAFQSRQGTVAANHFFFDHTLELRGQADAALGPRNDSVDFPNRYVLGTGLQLGKDARLVASQEFTDGETFDSRATRVGLEAVPWEGSRLTSTLNQSQVSEYGPRTFAQMGLTQALMLGEHWGLDLGADANRTLHESGSTALVIDTAHPIASGGSFGAGTLTEDFEAFSLGATYREALWSWNGRAESRDGQASDRLGFSTGFLRQARAGVAFAASARDFETRQAAGARGRLASVDLSWAWRPLGEQEAMLDKLEYRMDEVHNGSGVAGSALFGANGLVASGDARVRRLVNNLAINHVSRQWDEEDRHGDLFNAVERDQWSLYYGSKYSFDSYEGVGYAGYTDLLGLELRYDLNHWLDLGLQGSGLHSWSADTVEYSVGPRIGFTPADNGWLVLGWNFKGFRDADFEAARYTAEGPYLQLRFKFDQNTRLAKDRQDPRAPAAGEARAAGAQP